MRRLKITDIAVLFAVAAGFLYFFRSVPSPQPFVYDESDYMTAGSRGLIANVLETPTTSLFGFFEIGLNHSKLDKRSSLSEFVRSSRDIDFYRHFHGPLYYYWLALLSPLVHGNEYWMRFSGYAFHLLTFFTIALGVFFLTGFRSAALVASFLYLFGQASISTAAIISAHAPYVFFSALTLLLFAGYLQTGSPRLWYFFVAAFTCAFCSIDYAILLLVTAVICLFVFRKTRLPTRSVVLRSVLLFFGLLVILWPMGLFKLTALKGYFYIAYLAMQRKGSYGDYGPFTIWWQRFNAAPVEYSIDLLSLAGIFALWRRQEVRQYRALLLPCMLYALFMLLTTLKNTSLNPTYVSSILPPLAVVSGTALAALAGRSPTAVRAMVTGVLLLATVLGGYQLILRKENDVPGPNADAQIMSQIRAASLTRSVMVVPFEILPPLSYYFPGMQLHPYLATDDAAALQQKIRDFDAAALIYRARPDDDFPRKLLQGGGYSEVKIGDADRTSLFYANERH